MPHSLRQRVQHLRDSMRFLALDPSYHRKQQNKQQEEQLQMIRRAVLESSRLELHYQKRQRLDRIPPIEPRRVDPYGMVNVHGALYLIGYCHLRKGVRQFRLDRIRRLDVLPERFRRPEEFSIQQYQPEQNRNLIVRVQFPAAMAAYVRESRPFFWETEKETEQGLEVTLRVRDEDEVLSWILSWGGQALVLEPSSLRHKIYEQARHMIARYDPEG
ncbi:WYL domain-containing protein [Brevibacillus humidisoli]|uniref:helix-turn-helix transcriptional regulator n=1 Tax=Brevibacillus humidisoli TaxID=2895522 RepID=UPI001E3A8E09|nr:WYL domain-containing protein [Brevibacillus humidisoli]UFJ42006.1 WYL domain-containing protein [Brevibacillus humidisoli]